MQYIRLFLLDNNKHMFPYLSISHLSHPKQPLYNLISCYLSKNKNGLYIENNKDFLTEINKNSIPSGKTNNNFLIIETTENIATHSQQFPYDNFYKYLLHKKVPVNHVFEEIEYLDKEKLTVNSFYSENSFGHTFYSEKGYLDLMKHVLETDKEGRDTRNSVTFANFGHQLVFNLMEGFPLLTTKKVLFDKVVSELLMFLKGDTNTKVLEEQNNLIWKSNTSKEFLQSLNLDYPEGEMGPMYGYNWRHFGRPYGKDFGGVDQLEHVIKLLINDPYSRRIIMTTYDPVSVDKCVLYPCHGLSIQFFVRDEYDKKVLDIKMYQRSADLFLGVPFNIASYALLNCLMCEITGFTPGNLIVTFGDVHIYKSHLDAVNTQLERYNQVLKFPKLNIKKKFVGTDVTTALEYLTSLETTDIVTENYEHGTFIKAQMVA